MSVQVLCSFLHWVVCSVSECQGDLAGALPYQPECNPPSLFPGKLMQTGGTGLILKWNFGDESFSGKAGAEDIIICGKCNVANTWHANEVKTLQLLPGMN